MQHYFVSFVFPQSFTKDVGEAHNKLVLYNKDVEGIAYYILYQLLHTNKSLHTLYVTVKYKSIRNPTLKRSDQQAA